MTHNIITTDKLCKTFSTGGLQQHVLRNLDLQIRTGDFTVIMGASGAGKSTLLYALSGIDTPTLGKIRFGDEEIDRMSSDRLAVFRRRNCGFVFQQIYLCDNMSLMDNVMAAGLLVNRNRRQVAARAAELFIHMGLTEQDWHKFPAQLSGGEAQRGAIVRALINTPTVLFADEPTGSLNSASGDAVLDLLTQTNRDGQSIIMVTHDLKSALRGKRVLYLKDGIIRGECALGNYLGDIDVDRGTVLLSTQRETEISSTTTVSRQKDRPSVYAENPRGGSVGEDTTHEVVTRRKRLHRFLAEMGW
ncbi:MAG: ABC transporter ATP-binding protein [Coriobacteriales bacterium]|jgi:putative ABC transport system ATP-binding protein|nr:ABC transporter ATP-binding protein [Coriobacteriales bacterium]